MQFSGFVLTHVQNQLDITKANDLKVWSSAVLYSDIIFLVESRDASNERSPRNPLWIFSGDCFSALRVCQEESTDTVRLLVHARTRDLSDAPITFDIVEEVIGIDEHHPVIVSLKSGTSLMLEPTHKTARVNTLDKLYPVD